VLNEIPEDVRSFHAANKAQDSEEDDKERRRRRRQMKKDKKKEAEAAAAAGTVSSASVAAEEEEVEMMSLVSFAGSVDGSHAMAWWKSLEEERDRGMEELRRKPMA